MPDESKTGRKDTLQSHEKPNRNIQGKADAQPGTEETPYERTHTGLRAAGHGGGELDGGGIAPEERTEQGYAFGGGGQGHTPVRSQQYEAEEDLESRSGPFTRTGRPGGDAQKGAAETSGAEGRKDSAQASSPRDRKDTAQTPGAGKKA
ncbi:hypothetical protein CSC67_17185 [Pusillimonas caeni]|uniref:hypothetical protein n=1 Tax=Pusillimonas caeni TaxID=1348472 RepID=UPI000E59AC4A|nr:hypothetical protein [Pusillimonas caeni]TFL11276.1 hypothetical protein CSC67_17185 [Pusillimonas caeni]